MADRTLQMTLLYDFYGELLTDRQRELFDLYYNEDLSLAEIAQQYGISRQGVRANLMHAEKTLLQMEEKTGFAAGFEQRQSYAARGGEIIRTLRESHGDEKTLAALDELERILDVMKG
ncbi:MAG: YlxM family DNA-binding protein [Clostridia bacterium]|nr:YlxM family DNA-binding protein [Clostridia bacterium]MBR6207152.1 YlxM family DNA-binding protein [Oscillospiraceae bacterium]